MHTKLIGLLLIPLLLNLSSCGETKPVPPTLQGSLHIQVTQQAKVAEPLPVLVQSPADQRASGQTVSLIVFSSYGPQSYHATFSQQVARFLLPANELRQSGQLRLLARAGNAQGSAIVTLQPGSAVSPLIPLIGARAIIADTIHWSMAVVVPFDRFGNPVADNTTIQIRALHPGNKLESKNIQTKHLLAWTRIMSGTQAGRTTISARIGSVRGPESVLLETAGWPIPFSVFADPSSPPADGRQLVLLRTDIIRDKYDNVVPDGTLVTFIVNYPTQKVTSIAAYTLGGVAQAYLQAPQEAGEVQVHATLLGAESKKLTMDFPPGLAVQPFTVNTRREAGNNAYQLIAGPLLGPEGQYVANGLPVRFLLTDKNGTQFALESNTRDGYARTEVRIALYPRATYTVTAIIGSAQATTRLTLP